MFGFIRPCEAKLSKEQINIFKSYYCGVCKSMAARYNKACQFTLTYDAAFLALFLSSLRDTEPDCKNMLCVMRKKNISISKEIDYCADINILLAYYKLEDDVNDEGSKKAKLAQAVLKTAYLEAKEKNNEMDRLIKSNLEYLYLLEKEECDEPDFVADAFGRLLAGVVGYGCNMNKEAMAVGLNLGKYIYLLDAYVDYEKDIKEGNYNVFYLKYGHVDNLKEEITFLMESILSEMSKHYKQVNILHNKEILDNILYLGIIQKLLEADCKDNNKMKEEKDESIFGVRG